MSEKLVNKLNSAPPFIIKSLTNYGKKREKKRRSLSP
jgi:hypothetical protein